VPENRCNTHQAVVLLAVTLGEEDSSKTLKDGRGEGPVLLAQSLLRLLLKASFSSVLVLRECTQVKSGAQVQLMPGKSVASLDQTRTSPEVGC
jgi:hypothetical protein